jgi:hypothetical protein
MELGLLGDKLQYLDTYIHNLRYFQGILIQSLVVMLRELEKFSKNIEFIRLYLQKIKYILKLGIIFPVLFNIKSDMIKHDKLYLITLKADY